MTEIQIGPQQRASLNRLKWRPLIAKPGDRALTSLVHRNLATAKPVMDGLEYRITFAGCVAIGAAVDDQPEQEAA